MEICQTDLPTYLPQQRAVLRVPKKGGNEGHSPWEGAYLALIAAPRRRRRGFKSNYFTIHEIISTFLPLFTGISCVLWRRAPTVTVAVNLRAETQSLDWYKQNDLSSDLPTSSSSSFGRVPSMFFSPGPPLRLRLLYGRARGPGVPVLDVLEAESGLIVVNSRGRG